MTGTVISSTAFNALTADLGTGLTTALTKDGQTTPTANIPMGTYKITGLGAGTVATDAVRFSQLQNFSTSTLITVAGTDTITGTVSPSLTAYTAGQIFSFVVGATNTSAVTLNIDGLGAKSVTRAGTVALAAGDMVTGQVALVEYDGTQFQLLDPNAFTNLRVSGTLGVTGVTTHTGATTMSAALTYGGVTLSNAVTGTGNMVLSASPTFTGTISAAAITASGDITSNSDLAFKSNIEIITNALDKLSNIKGITFNSDGVSHRRTGVIAQDVQTVLPEAIHTNSDGHLSVAYGNMIGLLVEAIKELNQKVKNMEESSLRTNILL